MTRVFLGLGSNLGDRRESLDHALDLLSAKVRITSRSSYYETEPVGYADQPWFMNRVVAGETALTPTELLAFTQSVEHALKRVKTIRWGPRTIDVDILLYDDVVLDTDSLTIPHPRMKERAFVMVPLAEIAPGLVIGGETVEAILTRLEGEAIRKLED